MVRQLKRLKKLVDILNENIGKPITQQELTSMVEDRVGYYVCKSSVEKDLKRLWVDFDIDIESGRTGMYMTEKVDFYQRLDELLK